MNQTYCKTTTNAGLILSDIKKLFFIFKTFCLQIIYNTQFIHIQRKLITVYFVMETHLIQIHKLSDFFTVFNCYK